MEAFANHLWQLELPLSGLPGGVIKGSSHNAPNFVSDPDMESLIMTVPFAGLIRCGWRLKKKGGTENQALGRSRGGLYKNSHHS